MVNVHKVAIKRLVLDQPRKGTARLDPSGCFNLGRIDAPDPQAQVPAGAVEPYRVAVNCDGAGDDDCCK